MAKDMSKEFVQAMNEISEAKKELEFKGYLPYVQEKLEKALQRLNAIAAFYKIQ